MKIINKAKFDNKKGIVFETEEYETPNILKSKNNFMEWITGGDYIKEKKAKCKFI